MRGLAWAELESLKVPVDDDWGKHGRGSSHNSKKDTPTTETEGRRGLAKDLGCGYFFSGGCVFLFVFVLRKTLKSSYKGGLLMCNERNEKRHPLQHPTASQIETVGLQLFLSFRRLSLVFACVLFKNISSKNNVILLVL